MNPVLVNIWRGNHIESRHRGAVAVVDASGKVVFSLGDIQRSEFPRSSLKLLQAIPLIETGAAAHFNLSNKHISLACASHNGESTHTELVSEWLSRIGCQNEDLECGAELPKDQDTQFELIRSGGAPQRIHHNCSGKHCGLLTIVKFKEESTRNYRLYNHPAQRRWFEVIENLTGMKSLQIPWGYDGCGIPNLALPLQRVAWAYARFANPQTLAAERRAAIETITAAIVEHPYLIAGKDRLCTALMALTGRDVLVKTGAEGFYIAVLPNQGLGVALKIDDGHHRGSQVAIGAVLEKLGVLTSEQSRALQEYLRPTVTNSRGDPVGHIEPSTEWGL